MTNNLAGQRKEHPDRDRGQGVPKGPQKRDHMNSIERKRGNRPGWSRESERIRKSLVWRVPPTPWARGCSDWIKRQSERETQQRIPGTYGIRMMTY
jgi:hypothetical protein